MQARHVSPNLVSHGCEFVPRQRTKPLSWGVVRDEALAGGRCCSWREVTTCVVDLP